MSDGYNLFAVQRNASAACNFSQFWLGRAPTQEAARQAVLAPWSMLSAEYKAGQWVMAREIDAAERVVAFGQISGPPHSLWVREASEGEVAHLIQTSRFAGSQRHWMMANMAAEAQKCPESWWSQLGASETGLRYAWMLGLLPLRAAVEFARAEVALMPASLRHEDMRALQAAAGALERDDVNCARVRADAQPMRHRTSVSSGPVPQDDFTDMSIVEAVVNLCELISEGAKDPHSDVPLGRLTMCVGAALAVHTNRRGEGIGADSLRVAAREQSARLGAFLPLQQVLWTVTMMADPVEPSA